MLAPTGKEVAFCKQVAAVAAAPAGAQGEGHSVGERIWIKKWYC